MRRVCALLTLLAAANPSPVFAADQATVAVSAQVASRSSLRVSTETLQFVVPEGGTTATASLDFIAAARVAHGDAVVLRVEPARGIEGPGGASDVETSISFSGEGEGAQSGVLSAAASVAGEWQGSGQRQGRLIFTLHASAPGVYRLPVKLAIQAR